MRVIVWYSDGAASTIAAMEAVKEYGDCVEIWYCDTSKREHPDNLRYRKEISAWIGTSIKVGRTKNPDYLDDEGRPDIYKVFEQTGWLVGPGGARCTVELKKAVRHEIERAGDIQVFGFTSDEQGRIDRFNKNNPEIKADHILARKGISKSDCYRMIKNAGIELPMMYRMGYRNNNCIGCVKGQAGYWNKIRRDFPEVFDKMAKIERKMNVAINKRYDGKNRIRVFLDELPPDAGRYEREPDIECGVLCQTVS